MLAVSFKEDWGKDFAELKSFVNNDINNSKL